jgi:N-methylhydantoinase A
MGYVIGVDIGGTFTDCVVADDAGTITLAKALSTPPDFANGVLDVLAVAAESLSVSTNDLLGETRLFLHSTTVAENAVVEGKLAPAGLLVTRGFQHTLEASRGSYGRWAGLTVEEKKDLVHTDKLDPLVPMSLIWGIKERTDSRGNTILAVDESEVEQAVEDLRQRGVSAIGISFLWSFLNPDNEAAARAVVQRLWPDIFCTTSHEIAPNLGEFERTQSVALNARLDPLVSGYLTALQKNLRDAGFAGKLLVMHAYGGLVDVGDGSHHAVGLIESGPVSGLVGSQFLGKSLGYENIIAADMGGTTFKAGVIRDGLIEYQREPLVYRYPYTIPKMDVLSLGVAGGSIVWLDPNTGRPQIGPRSAGATPGPICYGFGGDEPTVTDVDLLLGYLHPDRFLDGRQRLDTDRALELFKEKIAGPLAMDVDDALRDIYRLTNSLLFDWLHKLTVERGLNPAAYVLFAYGGTAGMHLVTVAEQLGLPGVVVPHTASVHGAYGLVTGDVTHELHTTHPLRAGVSADAVNEIFGELQERGLRQLQGEGFEAADMVLLRTIDMRFKRQLHQVSVPVAGGDALTDEDLEATLDRFERMYMERYGEESAYREAGIELVVFRIRAIGKLAKPASPNGRPSGKSGNAGLVETRTIYSDKTGDLTEAAGYDFNKLAPGDEMPGPAIIWTPITTIVLNPDQTALCDESKNIVVTWG